MGECFFGYWLTCVVLHKIQRVVNGCRLGEMRFVIQRFFNCPLSVCLWCIGVRTFCPKPVAKVIMNVGGTASLLGLVAMAADIEGLYASVKALVCVVRSNKLAAKEMDRIKGYQVC